MPAQEAEAPSNNGLKRTKPAQTTELRCLTQAAAATTRAEDRPQFQDRLAEAARMFAAAASAPPEWETLRAIVADVERSLGWSYLPGSSGAGAEAAFATVRAVVGRE
jgi:hypothetical protein